MLINSVKNSDSEQCTKSRLGQVHSVHTPMAQAVRTLRARPAVSWRTRRRVAGLPRPYRGLLLCRVVARTDRVTVRIGHVAARIGHVAARIGHVAARIGHVVARTGRVAARLHALLSVMSQTSSAVSCARLAVLWLCPAVSLPPPSAPRPACLLSLLCACLACCVPQYNLLYATIQPVVL